MFNAENAIKKWGPVLDHGSAPKIKDAYRRAVTATLLENQERAMKEERAHSLNEGTGAAGNGGFDPILISLVRRAMPNLIAYDIAGVQPMSAPTGLIFALRSKYGGSPSTGHEALFGGRPAASAATAVTRNLNCAGTINSFTLTILHATVGGALLPGSTITGTSIPDGTVLVTGLTAVTTVGQTVTISKPLTATIGAGADNCTVAYGPAAPIADSFSGPNSTTTSEGNISGEMGFQIEKTTVTANTRALKAEYTMELAQDLKAVHGLDAESELANILSTEILLEINREVINKINAAAVNGGGVTAGYFKMYGNGITGSDSDGRWSVEKFKSLLMQIENC